MIYRKYEFTPKQWATLRTQVETTTTSEGVDYTAPKMEVVAGIAEIKDIVITPAVMNELEAVTPAVLSLNIAVDILWQETPLPAFDAYMVWPAQPKHYFGGWEQDYQDAYAEQVQ